MCVRARVSRYKIRLESSLYQIPRISSSTTMIVQIAAVREVIVGNTPLLESRSPRYDIEIQRIGTRYRFALARRVRTGRNEGKTNVVKFTTPRIHDTRGVSDEKKKQRVESPRRGKIMERMEDEG